MDCWVGAYSYEACCLAPAPPLHCFDSTFTFSRCCGGDAALACPPTPGPEPPYHDVERLLDRYGTDKGNLRHMYHRLYGSLLEQYRASTRLVLEVGVGTLRGMKYPPGQSLRAWRDFFPSAEVVGLDIDSEAAVLGEERIVTVVGIDTTEPWSVVERLRPWRQGSADIIIDDGAHDPVLQGKTLLSMWSWLRDGGVYVVEDLEYKYAWLHAGPEHQHLGNGASHHLCAMRLHEPFVFGSMQALYATLELAVLPKTTNYTPAGLDKVLRASGVFYVATKAGLETSNLMVLPKNWAKEELLFQPLANHYHLAYNVLLRGASVRVVVAQHPGQAAVWREAFPEATVLQGAGTEHCEVDILVTSADSPGLDHALLAFARLRRGGYLFVEAVAFSFCDGTPLPRGLGPAAAEIAEENPDWFFAMTQDEWPHDGIPDYKLLVLRKK